MPRDPDREKMLRELADYEAEHCEHETAKKILERMKAARGARGVPLPEDFATHFACARCVSAFMVAKIAVARREGKVEGLREAIQTMTEIASGSTDEGG